MRRCARAVTAAAEAEEGRPTVRGRRESHRGASRGSLARRAGTAAAEADAGGDPGSPGAGGETSPARSPFPKRKKRESATTSRTAAPAAPITPARARALRRVRRQTATCRPASAGGSTRGRRLSSDRRRASRSGPGPAPMPTANRSSGCFGQQPSRDAIPTVLQDRGARRSRSGSGGASSSKCCRSRATASPSKGQRPASSS